jgi:hypothetical protein
MLTGVNTTQHAELPVLAQPALLLNIGAPIAAYEVLTNRGASELTGLLVAAIFPVLAVALGAVRVRRLDPIGALSLAAIALGLAGTLFLHDPRVLLVKDSVITGGLGLAFLGSLLTTRPLLFVVGRQLTTGSDPARVQRYDELWASASYRRHSREATLIWGLALVGEAALRVVVSFLVPPGVLVAISPLLAVAVFGPLALWTIRRRRALGLGAAPTTAPSPDGEHHAHDRDLTRAAV